MSIEFEDALRESMLASRTAAIAEAQIVNAKGREERDVDGRYEDRMWIDPEEWSEMRPAILLIAGVAGADGVISSAESALFGQWVERWLNNSHWGAHYRDSKLRAINMIAPEFAQRGDTASSRMAAFHCCRNMRGADLCVLADLLQDMRPDSGAEGADMIDWAINILRM
ncbi:hypothetical protein [Stakelama tenebrarum]|uniref:Co-chaperone DjlA N-terminal domain-containing protein n=1 Tax=Stakelama tenebrarum TaxID=2711215 RepID=A0A6G6Y5U7_9SPHN|nr:hypothetical protein [Sphingosinithalassobacter tenebrarum]QIG79963.1 hypothetical protein G5C33_09370 [Sphingosinithalassobacter tenebrarum]